jgi:hypothetical protein
MRAIREIVVDTSMDMYWVSAITSGIHLIGHLSTNRGAYLRLGAETTSGLLLAPVP